MSPLEVLKKEDANQLINTEKVEEVTHPIMYFTKGRENHK
jgi:hypothetical protein